jgi:hypothetical protein
MKKVIIDPEEFKKIVEFIASQSMLFEKAVELNNILVNVKIMEVETIPDEK